MIKLMNDEEQRAVDLLNDFQRIVMEDWKLLKNGNLHIEFCGALHVLQGFVIQHMLQRVAPEEFGKWYTTIPDAETKPDLVTTPTFVEEIGLIAQRRQAKRD